MKPPPAPPRRRLADQLACTLRRLWQAYRVARRRCRRHCAPPAVHGLRVATRRLLAQLDLLRQLCPGPSLAKMRRLLKGRLESLAALRDGQVQVAAVHAQLRLFPELRPLHTALKKNTRRCRTATAQALAADRSAKLRQCLPAVLSRVRADGAEPAAARRQHAAIERALRGRLRQAAARHRAAGQTADGRHRVRIALKKYRYLLEALPPGRRGFGRARLARLVEFQAVAGELQDLAALLARIESLVAKEKLEAWRTHRFRETLVRRHTALATHCDRLARDLFAHRAAALRCALARP